MTASDWVVYVLHCGDGSLYTGVARDLDKRLKEHNAGTGAKYTRGRLPVTLAYCEPATDRSSAQQREAAIKKLSRSDKLLLITQQAG